MLGGAMKGACWMHRLDWSWKEPVPGVGSRVGQQGGFIAHRALLCLCCLRAGIIQRRGGKYSKETEYTESQSSSSIHMHAC